MPEETRCLLSEYITSQGMENLNSREVIKSLSEERSDVSAEEREAMLFSQQMIHRSQNQSFDSSGNLSFHLTEEGVLALLLDMGILNLEDNLADFRSNVDDFQNTMTSSLPLVLDENAGGSSLSEEPVAKRQRREI